MGCPFNLVALRLGALTHKDWMLFPIFKNNLMAQNVVGWLRGRTYGEWKVYRALLAATRSLDQKYPGSRVAFLDVSGPMGEPLEGHLSHHHGIDVDILYLARDGRGHLYPRYPALLNPGYGLKYGRDRRHEDLRFDTARNWALIQALRANKADPVELIFVQPYIKRWLIEEGREERASPDALAWADAKLCYAGDYAADHKDHMHVRFVNDKAPAGKTATKRAPKPAPRKAMRAALPAEQ
jgi:murein endopeptidase